MTLEKSVEGIDQIIELLRQPGGRLEALSLDPVSWTEDAHTAVDLAVNQVLRLYEIELRHQDRETAT